MSAKGHRLWKLAWLVIALAVLAGVFAPEVAAAGHRVVARVDEPFEVNGELFPQGTVAIREVASYNPTVTLIKVWVGGECLGQLLAGASADETASTSDMLVFERTARGHLALIGFTYRGETMSELYRFDMESGRRWLPPVNRSEVVVASK